MKAMFFSISAQTNSTTCPRLRTSGSLFLSLVLLLLLPSALHAQFSYVTNDGSITITGYTGPGGEVIIPEALDGFPVTSIGDAAFYWSPSVTSVIVGYGIGNIGVSAFHGCINLTSITLGTSLTNIGEWAFYQCASLTNVASRSLSAASAPMRSLAAAA